MRWSQRWGGRVRRDLARIRLVIFPPWLSVIRQTCFPITVLCDTPLLKDIATLLEWELRPGERIAWTGQPIPPRFAWQGLGDVLFGIPCTAFAIFCMARATSRGDDFLTLFCIPFVLVGFGLLSGPYRMRLKAARTAYVITDQRALILDGHWWQSTAFRSCDPHHLGDIRCMRKPDGSGDLIFGCTCISMDEVVDYGFLAIHDVENAETLIRKLSKGSFDDDT